MSKETTIRIPKDARERLTVFLGELMSQTREMLTLGDAVRILLETAIILPKDLIAEVERFVHKRSDLGYTSSEDFIRDAVRHRLTQLSGEFEYISVPREDMETLDTALKEMKTPFLNSADYVFQQIKDALKKYEEWKKMCKKGP
ncbi:MAG: ribbon-helix-helix domain-containing protein [Candidatus Bathyarchaeia archaeon]